MTLKIKTTLRTKAVKRAAQTGPAARNGKYNHCVLGSKVGSFEIDFFQNIFP